VTDAGNHQRSKGPASLLTKARLGLLIFGAGRFAASVFQTTDAEASSASRSTTHLGKVT
jgi:hypothetical protein